MTDGKTRARSEMKDFPITNRDVVGLINALSEMSVKLTRGQWGLLLSILAASAGNVEVGEDKTKGTFPGVRVDGGVITDPRNKTVQELREQLQKAHMPAKQPGAPLGSMVSPPKTGPGKGFMVSPPPPGG
jgi:hypothetical protein